MKKHLLANLSALAKKGVKDAMEYLMNRFPITIMAK
jgi:hypothetical protein